MIEDGSDEDWMARARPLGPLLCDAAFRIADSLSIGPENDIGPADWERLRVPLDAADLPCRVPRLAATLDLPGREAALAAHYGRLIATTRRHGKPTALAQPFPYFSVTPLMLEDGQPVVSFPWTDDVPQTAAFLRALADAGPDGVVWDAIDQGWFLRILVRDGTLFIAEGDPDEGADVVVRGDAGAVAAQAAAALARLSGLHAGLIRVFGRDFWSYHG
ncbi:MULTISPECIES: hypothetical protein [Methylorubrum]|uniref:hypothetical protein n=1 Tax=Methylorubrum TaxID=2282523 RepID=UPI00209F394E|nr:MULTISPECIES: hypothetical protein [Methylorubrum]MCP1551313.1 hypothetical protein [Methylorubrum zatmanii]MCP1552071.1 hypothetical protein [Methylorubrum extorquens]MCP1581618.1 hypothetical protein [Methylorubrum extorquens]